MPRQSKAKIQVRVDGQVSMDRSQVPTPLRDALYTHLTWENPEYRDRTFRGQPTRYYDRKKQIWIEVPRHVFGIEQRGKRYYIAREFVPELEKLCGQLDIDIEYDDRRVLFTAKPLPHKIELWEPQRPAVEDMLNNDYGHQGVLEAPCGSGKTVMLLYIVATLGQPTLILAHTDDLLNQWKDYCKKLLGYDPGRIQGDTFDVKQITLASVMTLARRELDDEFLRQWGCVILDEAHHCPAACFQEVMTKFPAYFRFGATATPEREDKLTGLLYAICGPVIAKVDRKALKAAGLIVDPHVMAYETGFQYPYQNQRQWHPMVSALTADSYRNQLIVDNIIADHEEGDHVQLVLSQHIDHLLALSALLRQRAPEISQELLLAGGTKKNRAGVVVRTLSIPKAQRQAAIEKARKGRVSVLFGTKLADEGLDIPRLDRLHLVFPTRAKGKIAQQVGRIQRVHPRKRNVVVRDYVDDPKPLRSQWYDRRRVYVDMGLEITRVENQRKTARAALTTTQSVIARVRKAATGARTQTGHSVTGLLRAKQQERAS